MAYVPIPKDLNKVKTTLLISRWKKCPKNAII